jgi:hypothetical protein
MRLVAGTTGSRRGDVCRYCGTSRRRVRQAPLLKVIEPRVSRRLQMLDLIMLAIGLAFFALSLGYTYACDRL